MQFAVKMPHEFTDDQRVEQTLSLHETLWHLPDLVPNKPEVSRQKKSFFPAWINDKLAQPERGLLQWANSFLLFVPASAVETFRCTLASELNRTAMLNCPSSAPVLLNSLIYFSLDIVSSLQKHERLIGTSDRLDAVANCSFVIFAASIFPCFNMLSAKP